MKFDNCFQQVRFLKLKLFLLGLFEATVLIVCWSFFCLFGIGTIALILFWRILDLENYALTLKETLIAIVVMKSLEENSEENCFSLHVWKWLCSSFLEKKIAGNDKIDTTRLYILLFLKKNLDMDTNILSTSKKSEPNISGLGAIYLTF